MKNKITTLTRQEKKDHYKSSLVTHDGSPNLDALASTNVLLEKDQKGPLEILKDIKLKNVNRLVIGHLNINSLRNKFHALQMIIKGNADIFVFTESKLDDSFPSQQFAMDGYIQFRADRNADGGGGGTRLRQIGHTM